MNICWLIGMANFLSPVSGILVGITFLPPGGFRGAPWLLFREFE